MEREISGKYRDDGGEVCGQLKKLFPHAFQVYYDKYMRRIVACFVSLLCLLLVVSCFGSDFVNLKISAAQSSTSTSSKAIYNAQKYDFEDDVLKEEVRGEPVVTVTPSAFILNVARIRLFNPTDTEDLTKGAYDFLELVSIKIYDFDVPDHNIIPTRYNMLSSKGIQSLSLPLSLLKKEWHGLSLMFAPEGDIASNGMWGGSIIGIKKDSLPSYIKEDDIKNTIGEIPFGIKLSDDSVWFSYDSLFPFKNCGRLNYISFYDGSDNVYFMNPESEMGIWNFGPEYTEGNASGMIFPMDTISLTDLQNPEITISVDTENLIEFYQTSDGKYYASLAKSNPFPFRVTVDEYDPSVFLYSEQAIKDIKDAVPFDCFDYKMRTDKGIWHVLAHTQPNYSGLSYVEIFRSSESSFDERVAELIYTGEELSIVDYNAPQNGDVYYFIRNVNSKGEKSEAKLFTQVDTYPNSDGRNY